MCYRLFLTSPLTLSEVRSMLPEGMTADLLSPALQRFFLDHLPRARTAMRLRYGGCACDLAGRRAGSTEENERTLRTRYRREGADRGQVVRALEAHRRQPPVPTSDGPAARVFTGFVAEHARNAGPSLYLLDFSPDPERHPRWPGDPVRLTAAEVRREPDAWLTEEAPVLVLP